MIRLSSLGDVAMTVPVLLAFRRQYPEIPLIFLTKGPLAPILERIPLLEVHALQAEGKHRGLWGLYRLRRELHRRDYSKIADLHGALRTQILRVLFAGSGKSFEVLKKGRREKRRLTSGDPEYFKPLRTTHERYADVFRSLGYGITLTAEDLLPPEPWPEALAHELERETSCRVGIAPFADFAGKRYPLDQMKKVVEMLARIPGIRIYLFGGGAEEVAELRSWEAAYTHCFSAAGVFGLSEELAVISNLDLMLSMDSGNGHLAANYGIPVLTIWGVTHPYAGFAPFLQPASHAIVADRDQYPKIPTSVYGNRVLAGYDNAMRTISPIVIYERIAEVLRTRGISAPYSGTRT